MNKKGIEWSLKHLAKMFMGAMTFLVLVGVLWLLWGVFFAEEVTTATQVAARAKAELEAFTISNICSPVLTQGKDYEIKLYPGDKAPKECANRDCICVKETGKPEICEALNPKILKKQKMGVAQETSTGNVDPGEKIQVCNDNNQLSIKVI